MALLPWSLLRRKREESQPSCHDPVVMETDRLGFITRLLFSRYDVAVETVRSLKEHSVLIPAASSICFVFLLAKGA